jgi:PAS domain S-box
MDLQKKTLLVLVTFLILAVALTGVFVAAILLANYQTLEKEYMTNDLMQTVSVFKNNERTLSAVASDWAPWDDAYDFVGGDRPDFIKRNINPDAFANQQISFLIITNRSGECVWAGAYNATTNTIVPVSPGVLAAIRPESPLLTMGDPRADTTGILVLPEGPALVTSHPIVRTDFSGPARGVLIMGRYLDENGIQGMAGREAATVEILHGDDTSLSALGFSGREGKTPLPSYVVTPLNGNVVAGYALFDDIYGRPALVLKMTESRALYEEGINTIYQFILILLFTEMLFGFVMIFFLDRVVLSRIKTLSSQVREIGSGNDRTSRVTLDGNDELAALAREINVMLDDIEMTNSELLSSETRYRELAENTSDVIFTLDTKGKVQYITPSVNRYSYLIEEVVGQDVSRFIYTSDRTRMSLEFQRQIADCSPMVSSFRLVDKWGFIHWMEVKSTVSMDVYGNVTGITGVLRDFSDRKRAEEAVMLANRKLNLLNNITRHDILNTITALLGCVDMAKATKDPAEREELFGQIKDLTRVIQRQIEFTREYQSVGVNAPTWQNLKEILRRATVNFAGAGITISGEIENTEIYADPLLEKVIYNLIDNAIRYGETITTIRFYYQISDAGFTLICEDDGVGIPEKDKESIFERGVGKNTGMGLFLTREILSITGIAIREVGKPGAGARFEMQIPNGAFRFVHEH